MSSCIMPPIKNRRNEHTMPVIRLQGNIEKQRGIYYEYDPTDTPLGEGGMGKVYKGWCCDVNTGQRREVAIKFLYSDLPQHVIARARREAAVQLRNDNLIEMLGFLEVQDKDCIGQPIIRYHVISEYLNGISLDSLLEGKITNPRGEVIPFAQELYGKYQNDPYHFAIIVIRSLLSGLMALHDAGYVHRDIDPSNIMITADGHIKLIDSGIAKKTTGKNTKESSYTVPGQFIGKPKYAAPELARGLVDSVGPATDIYAVGCLLFQLVVGRVPFDGEMAEVLEMQLTRELPLREIKQKTLREIIRKATQKKMNARYLSAAEFRVAVDKLAALPYPDKGIDWKMIGSVCAAVVLACALVGGGIKLLNLPSEPSAHQGEETTKLTDKVECGTAWAMMKNPATAQEGYDALKQLAQQDDPQALYLLSRLYFLSGEESDVAGVPDSLKLIREQLGISIDNAQAHALLKKAVALSPTNYHAQYELGCNYKSNRRGTTRNNDSAYVCLHAAREQAHSVGDNSYEQKISEKMSNLVKP